MTLNTCPHARAVAQALEAGTLPDDPVLQGHLQMCSTCLDAVFGRLGRRRRRRESPPIHTGGDG